MPYTDFLLEYLHNNVTKDVKTLQAKTGLPLSTIYRKIKVLREKGELKRKEGSGRPRIFSGNSKKPFRKLLSKTHHSPRRKSKTGLKRSPISWPADERIPELSNPLE